MSLLDVIKLLISAILIIGTFTLFVFHQLRRPFKELGILQKDIKALGRKIEESNVSRRRCIIKRKIKKPLKPKYSFRVSSSASIRIKNTLARLSDFEKIEIELSNVQTSMIIQNSRIETRLQQLEGYCHDLHSNMNTQDSKIQQLDYYCRTLYENMKIQDSSNILQLETRILDVKEDYLTLVGIAKSAKATQNKYLREVEYSFKDHEENLAIVYGDFKSRLDNLEVLLDEFIFEDKIKKLKRNGWYSP